MLHGLRVNGYQALVDGLPQRSGRALSTLLRRGPDEGCHPDEIRVLLAREYLVPVELLQLVEKVPKFSWTTDQGLAEMDTEIEGGFSALHNAGESDE